LAKNCNLTTTNPELLPKFATVPLKPNVQDVGVKAE
jgi:hypothetical protein